MFDPMSQHISKKNKIDNQSIERLYFSFVKFDVLNLKGLIATYTNNNIQINPTDVQQKNNFSIATIHTYSSVL